MAASGATDEAARVIATACYYEHKYDCELTPDYVARNRDTAILRATEEVDCYDGRYHIGLHLAVELNLISHIYHRIGLFNAIRSADTMVLRRVQKLAASQLAPNHPHRTHLVGVLVHMQYLAYIRTLLDQEVSEQVQASIERASPVQSCTLDMDEGSIRALRHDITRCEMRYNTYQREYVKGRKAADAKEQMSRSTPPSTTAYIVSVAQPPSPRNIRSTRSESPRSPTLAIPRALSDEEDPIEQLPLPSPDRFMLHLRAEVVDKLSFSRQERDQLRSRSFTRAASAQGRLGRPQSHTLGRYHSAARVISVWDKLDAPSAKRRESKLTASGARAVVREHVELMRLVKDTLRFLAPLSDVPGVNLLAYLPPILNGRVLAALYNHARKDATEFIASAPEAIQKTCQSSALHAFVAVELTHLWAHRCEELKCAYAQQDEAEMLELQGYGPEYKNWLCNLEWDVGLQVFRDLHAATELVAKIIAQALGELKAYSQGTREIPATMQWAAKKRETRNSLLNGNHSRNHLATVKRARRVSIGSRVPPRPQPRNVIAMPMGMKRASAKLHGTPPRPTILVESMESQM